jgi:DNA-binding MarR family transcriptional regulator
VTVRDFGTLIREITANANQYVGARAAISEELTELSVDVEADIFAGFSGDEREQFYTYLARLLRNTRKMAESVSTIPEE